MNKTTVKKLTVTAALLLVAALVTALFSGAGYSQTQNRSDIASGCGSCALACAACAACSACTCLSCMGGGLDLEGFDLDEYSDFDFEDYADYDFGGITDGGSSGDEDYDVGDYIDLN